jgi:phage-related protein
MPPPPVKLAKSAAADLLALPEAERENVLARLQEVALTFGSPHRHAGLGLRKLKGRVYEFRASRATRAVFIWREGAIWIEAIGDHQDVLNFLKFHKA